MFFGPKSFRNPQRGIPASVRRQMLLLFGLILGVGLIGFQAYRMGNRVDPAAEPIEKVGAIGFGEPVVPRVEGTVPGVTGVGSLVEAREPEPFVEDRELIAKGVLADRTGRFDEPLIIHLLHKSRASGGSIIAKETPVLSLEEPGGVVWQKLIASPDMYRGKLVEVKGEVVSPAPGAYPLGLRALDYPNPSGLDRAWQSFLLGVDRKLYIVATAEKGRELAHRDGVRLRAYFAQLYTYPVEHEGELRQGTIPLLVGRDFELLERPRVEGAGTEEILWVLGGLGIFAIAFVLLVKGKSRRHDPAQDEARLEALKARLHKKSASGRMDGARGGDPGGSAIRSEGAVAYPDDMPSDGLSPDGVPPEMPPHGEEPTS